MEDYKKIYPELLTKNPLKTETPSASNNLVGFLRILKRKQNITQVSGKSTKMLQLIVENQHIIRNSFVLSQRVWSWNSIFWGWPASRRITWRPWSYLWSCEFYHWRSRKKGFTESDETRKNCFCLRVKINSLKDRISKALADDRISDEEFENILAEMSKYNEMKKDIRVGFKNKVKKTRDGVDAVEFSAGLQAK